MLVWRRANSARGLLAASAAAALIATVLLAGLSDYNRTVIVAGGQSAVAAAPVEERALLIQGPATAADKFQIADTALRGRLANGLGGLDVKMTSAGYASGRQLVGDTGNAAGDANGLIFANVMFLDGMTQHGQLTNGAWPVPGADPVQAALGEPAANILGVRPGSRIPIMDRRTDKVTTIVVSGIFAAKDPNAAHWLLTPELGQGSLSGGATYGPFVIDQADFFGGTWPTGGSAGWVVEPQLTGAELTDLFAVREAIRVLPVGLPAATGMGSGLQVATSLEQLVDRLQRADLVGRSALLTPLLLIVVLGGYALLLLAGLLTEQRRQETALLRARGAGRGQLAGLAAREAVLVALPAAVLAPIVVTPLLQRIPALEGATLHPAATWAVALAAGLGCVLAMAAPALRSGTTYVDDLAARSRPSRATAVQRAGVDLALIAFAVLAWFQLRQYSSPLAGVGGQLGIDPLLAAAAPIGVLAGAVLALRLLPPLTRLAERLIDRRPWFATQLGMWQAGRRPHAGPVLLLALAVAVSTLAWALAGTAERSLVDQADHTAGADLRLTETSGFAPNGRAQAVADLPGITTVLPGLRYVTTLGEKATRATVLAIDAASAKDLVKLRDDLGDPDELFGALAAKRVSAPVVPLPAGAKELRGVIRSTGEVTTYLVLADPHGGRHRLRLPTGQDVPFQVKLPAAGLALAGFQVGVTAYSQDAVSWSVEDLTADGAAVDLTGDWKVNSIEDQVAPTPGNGTISATIRHERAPRIFSWTGVISSQFVFAVSRRIAGDVVPAVATPKALEALHKGIGETVSLRFGSASMNVLLVASVAALPGTDGPAAILLDLPSFSNVYFSGFGESQPIQEWWLATDPVRHAQAAQAARRLGNLRVADRFELANRAGQDPYGVGARIALFIAALGAMALALVGAAVDVRAMARRRIGELAVLHTLGASPRVLARALVTEQAFLAGLGVLVGLTVGLGVAATMAPLVILTPTADRPIPDPVLHLQWAPVLGTAGFLLVVAVSMAGMIALTMRNRLAAAQLRIGADQ